MRATQWLYYASLRTYCGLACLTLLFTSSVFTSADFGMPHPFDPPLGAELQTVQAPVADVDTDGDGLSDFWETHKYLTDPHKKDTSGKGVPDGQANQRKEFTYSITSVLKVLKPCRPADMNDDYQDVRVLDQDADSYTLEVTYYPLNTNKDAIGENPNWQRDDAGMMQYLKPTVTCNWDAQMRADLLEQLKQDGIEPDKLTDKQLVTQVSKWAIRRARYNTAFAVWFVTYPNGVPTVAPGLREAFDSQKPNKATTDQAMLDNEVLGRGMFYNKVHGSCTSSATYLTTIFRALGIPTRIVVCIPPVDGNDPAQVTKFLAGIHHHGVHATLEIGLDNHGFANHLFNEVYVGHHWVRLNYDRLGQNNLDEDYFGLLTHIYTVNDISELPLAATWGERFAHYAHATPKLMSENPYMLVSVSDHFGAYSSIPNPPVAVPELRAVTIKGVYWKSANPTLEGIPPASEMPAAIDLLIRIKEWIPERDYRQMARFYQRAGHNFVLQAPGHPDVRFRLNGDSFSNTGTECYIYTALVLPEDRDKVAAGVSYTVKPLNTSAIYTWSVAPGLTVHKP